MLSKKRVINKLKAFKVNEVSTVDAGANLFAEVLIAKRDGDEDLVATLEDFSGWIAKAELPGDTSAADAFEQFAHEQVAKAMPDTGALHKDKPMGGPEDKRECPHCGHDVPKGAPKCLACKRKVSKAFPPKAKKKIKAKVEEVVEDEEEEEPSSDVAALVDAPDDDPEASQLLAGDEEEDDDSNPFASDEEVDEDEEDSDNPFAGEDEEGEEEGPISEGENLEQEDFDPKDVQLPSDLPAEVGEYVGNLEALIEHLEQQMREKEQMTLAKADDTKTTGEDLDFLSDIAKALNEGEDVEYADLTKAFGQMATVVKGYEERAVSAETVAKAERDIRLTNEMTEVVKGWTGLPLDVNEFPLVLKRAKDALDEETFSALTKAFDAASEAASMAKEFGEDVNGLFDEVGKQGGGANTTDPLEQEVAKRIADDSSLSRPEAIAKVLEDKPELYDATRK